MPPVLCHPNRYPFAASGISHVPAAVFGIVTVCITAIYVITTFFAGFITGKREGSRKFLWGLLAGSIYFIILLILSRIMKSPGDLSTMHTLTVLALCAGGGMLGGMLS